MVAVNPGGADAVEGAAEFFVHTERGASVSCTIYDGYTERAEALCERVTKRYQAKDTLRPNGSVVLCRTHSLLSNRCELGNTGEPSPTYGPGRKRHGRALHVRRVSRRCQMHGGDRGRVSSSSGADCTRWGVPRSRDVDESGVPLFPGPD